jgi:hypothetical protein
MTTAKNARRLLLLLFWLPAFAGAEIQLRNGDPDQALVYWLLTTNDAPSLADLPRASLRHRFLAPGETVKVSWEGSTLVVCFLEWKSALGFTTLVKGSFFGQADLPDNKQVSLDHMGIQNQVGRILEGSLAQWGLTPPRLALGAGFSQWSAVPWLVQFGTSFAPTGGLKGVQLLVSPLALWFHFSLWSAPASYPGTSIVLKDEHLFWEVPIPAATGRVWQFDQEISLAVGSCIRTGTEVEGWIVLDRLDGASRKALLNHALELRWLVERSPTPDNLFMTEFSLLELP